MKKTIFTFCIAMASFAAANAQDHTGHGHDGKLKVAATATPTVTATPVETLAQTPAPAAPAKPSTLKPENVQFKEDVHDFKAVDEGKPAEHIFVFKNSGKEPLIIERVQPSCGCTTPEWTREPIKPGKTGMVKASYGTQGRPGHFEKTLTVFSNAGTKVLTIKGDVNKAPESSVPQNNSMMKTN